MTDSTPNQGNTIGVLQAEYERLAHAMQTGVAYTVEGAFGDDSASPKHLRTGVNSAMVTNGALVALLIDKGVFTLEEYMHSLVGAMQEEVTKYETILSERSGGSITLI